MNNLDHIRAFASYQTSQSVTADSDPDKSSEPYHAALKALAQSSEWLYDQALVEQVVSRLEAIEPQGSESRAQTAAIYMKIISPNGRSAPVRLNTAQIKISEQKTIELPKTLLMAESALLQRLLSHNSGQPIDLSGKASDESLTHLISHLTTGETGFVTNKNAVELLLLAKEFELSELAMKCLECLLDPDSSAVGLSSDGRQVSEEENMLRHLLKEARACSITISRLTNVPAHVKMGDGSKDEQWDCLRKLHDYIPLTHLELTKSKDLDHLLAFSTHNPGIVSLNLGESEDITDTYLEQLSQNLSKLRSFTIRSAPIKALPKTICDQVVTLNCSWCVALTNINAPNALTIDCNRCRALTTISADAVESLDCSWCVALTSIEAPNATTLNCSRCRALTSLSADNATTLNCVHCRALTSLSADSATTLNCSWCDALTSINAPRALTMDCGNCSALTSISADRAVYLACFFCRALTIISAPNVVTLDCSDCPALTSISAPRVVTLECYGSRALSNILQIELSNIVCRNIILTYYRNSEMLIELLRIQLAVAKSLYGLGVPPEFPLEQWFIKAQQLSIPADFNSPAERLACEEKISGFYERLVSYAAKESTLQGIDLSWFKELRKLDSPQQQLSRLTWLGSLLAYKAPGENPLADEKAISTLKAIGNLADPFLQDRATRALFAMYGTEAADRKDAWLSLKENRPDHQLLMCLFFARANIDVKEANQLLASLNVGYYTDFKVLNPILEMVDQLSSDSSLTAEERVEILQLVLKAPEQGPRENAKRYAIRVKEYRVAQPLLVNACRDLLLFQRSSELKKVEDVKSLLDRHKRACQSIFGVKEELLHAFTDTFKSQRCPNGLFTYAARLQTLPDNDKVLLTALLGRFVNGVLDRTFPESRYDLSNNEHLDTVFQGNEPLFNEWKKPLEIDVEQIENVGQDPEISPRDVVQGMMKRALENSHLGVDQAKFYPTLVAVLESNDPEIISTNISALKERLKDMQDQVKSSPSESQADLANELSHLDIEILCLQALDPRAMPAERKKSLIALRGRIPESIEFRNDVGGMIAALEPSQSSKGKWVKIETTESWEDSLLMGTEVDNSCQRIDGNPNLNKCLLAYILDGKNKLMIVRDSDGKIAARSVLRILWDDKEKRPVLFMEQIYTAKANAALQRLIMFGCVEKARRMGLPLVSSPSSFSTGAEYRGQLSALGGPAPFEYVDALRGIQGDGRFTILSSNIIYTPEAAAAAS